ncbi:hypothetical protein TNCT_64881 [Trichonephila clavata]|uniref:Uncharacterized protein n=1 Tax=Trichonephila clavata TaxID=2740835 RepID=A0A8X6FMR2_TRICU|nr:hypothetical protein TNCT_64881 [Trichonephila clavata]
MTRRCRKVELSSIRAEDIAWGQGETLPNVLFIAILLSQAPFRSERNFALNVYLLALRSSRMGKRTAVRKICAPFSRQNETLR